MIFHKAKFSSEYTYFLLFRKRSYGEVYGGRLAVETGKASVRKLGGSEQKDIKWERSKEP